MASWLESLFSPVKYWVNSSQRLQTFGKFSLHFDMFVLLVFFIFKLGFGFFVVKFGSILKRIALYWRLRYNYIWTMYNDIVASLLKSYGCTVWSVMLIRKLINEHFQKKKKTLLNKDLFRKKVKRDDGIWWILDSLVVIKYWPFFFFDRCNILGFLCL